MARCGCASDRCSCTVVAGEGVVVSGGGTRSNPYVVQAVAAGSGTDVPATARFSGEITMYGGLTAPNGWLICDGATVNRAVYADLFAAIGSVYGAGDGSTTFNLPNLSGKFAMGASGTYPRGQSGGTNSHTIALNQMPLHHHSINHDHGSFGTGADGAHIHSQDSNYNDTNTGSSWTTYRTGSTTGQTSTPATGSHAHTIDVPNYTGNSGDTGGGGLPIDHTPPYTSVNYIIKI